LEIDLENRPTGYEAFATFHPTFLYELLWVFAAAGVLIWAERWFKLVNGQLFALYIAIYCAGRAWVEMLRIDTANHILGLRLNVFTAVIIGIAAALWLFNSRQKSKKPTD
jgi:prolipoprotein diacylglyceryltransferase